MRLYRRDGVWHASFYDGRGRRVRRSTKCSDKRAAEALAKRWERAAQAADGAAADAPAYSLGQALEDLLRVGLTDVAAGTAWMYEQKAGHLNRLIGSVDLLDLSLDDVLGYINRRLDEGAARGSVSKELVTLRRGLGLAHERGLFLRVPSAIIPKFRARYVPRKRFLTIEEFQRLLAAFETNAATHRHQAPAQHRQLWIVVAVFTGGRYSEVAALDWSDVDWGRQLIHLRGTKTDGSDRGVPLHPVLGAVMANSRKDRGPVVGDWPNARRDLAAACVRAKLERVSPNDLRRTFASWMKQAGVDSYAVASLMGHSSARMVELVYGRLDQRALFHAMGALPGGAELRDTGVPRSRVFGALPAPAAQPPTGESPSRTGVSEVLGAGIEPATRGFSVRVFHAAPRQDDSRFRRKMRSA
jgi:integrase